METKLMIEELETKARLIMSDDDKPQKKMKRPRNRNQILKDFPEFKTVEIKGIKKEACSDDDDDDDSDDRKRLICKECGKVYTRAYGLRRHVNYHHRGRKYECEICKRKFSQSYVLLNHHCNPPGSKKRKIKESDKHKIFSCNKCEKRYSGKTYLLRHFARCGKIKFPCEYCPDKVYKTYSHLKRHCHISHANKFDNKSK